MSPEALSTLVTAALAAAMRLLAPSNEAVPAAGQIAAPVSNPTYRP